jgi:Nif-specific regulatory protein
VDVIELRTDQLSYGDNPAGSCLLSVAVLFSAAEALSASGLQRDPRAFETLLLNLVFSAVPAERAAVILSSSEAAAQPSVVDRQGESAKATHLTPELKNRVLSQCVAVLINDQPQGSRAVCSAMAVPLRLSSPAEPPAAALTPNGLLFAETSSGRFEESDLQLLAAIGVIGSTALESRRMFEWLSDENARLATEANVNHDIVGESVATRELLDKVARAARGDATVLIHGESGTGKELLARALHNTSPRARQAFVAVNCAAIPEALLESELFGYERGAFTGAAAQKKGKFELAQGGTLFLDEIGEMPLALQSKLLRVLQERELQRLGSARPVKLDVRVIASTNRDLDGEVKAGRFRSDLFYRLNVVALRTPSLRERPEDVLPLANHFLAVFRARAKRRVTGISPEAQRLLLAHDWPGNVRELQNAIERAVVMGTTEVILPEDLPDTLMDSVAPQAEQLDGALHSAIRAAKREAILGALQQSVGNFTRAAELLGVHPNYLHRLVNQLDLRADSRAVKFRLGG